MGLKDDGTVFTQFRLYWHTMDTEYYLSLMDQLCTSVTPDGVS